MSALEPDDEERPPARSRPLEALCEDLRWVWVSTLADLDRPDVVGAKELSDAAFV
ncbi:MAG: hypothetical protein MK297_10815 [Planctomycetes bacterium]|nr:hypothetical protein [Planctomycetota bacterium]